MSKKKGLSTKSIVAIVLVAVLCISVAAVVYAAEVSNKSSSNKLVVPGIQVGDTFYYNITGESILFTAGSDPDAEYPGFTDLNNTNYYEVTVTGINGSVVSLDTDWVFDNGTSVPQTQTIDVANGQLGDSTGFWGLYAPNLNVGNKLCPDGGDNGITVNATDTRTYTDSTRARNYWTLQTLFYNVNDPTDSTQQNNFIGVYFDKTTGIMITMTNVQEYNNPQMNLIITWQLTNSSEWVV
jgi:hypothetical protein